MGVEINLVYISSRLNHSSCSILGKVRLKEMPFTGFQESVNLAKLD